MVPSHADLKGTGGQSDPVELSEVAGVASTGKGTGEAEGPRVAGKVKRESLLVRKKNTSAAFNDHYWHFRKNAGQLERLAVRERSLRGRELLALTASRGILPYKGLTDYIRLCNEVNAGSGLAEGLGFNDVSIKALFALARTVAVQNIFPDDLSEAAMMYDALFRNDLSKDVREVDWIQYITLLTSQGKVAQAVSILERYSAGFQTSTARIEQALCLCNILKASTPSGSLAHPRLFLQPLNLLWRTRGLEALTFDGEQDSFFGLSTQSLDHVVDGGPKVTVIMTTFNPGAALPVAVRSVLNQTWRNLELIIVDDHSDPAAFDQVKLWEARDPRIKVIRNPKNQGTYVCKNIGIAASTGEYVTCHDSDDWSHPRKIELSMEVLLEKPSSVAVMSKWCRVTPDLDVAMFSGSGNLCYDNLSSLLFNKEAVINRIGYYDAVRTGADSEFKSRLELVFDQKVPRTVPLPLSFGLVHEKALTSNSFVRGWFSHDRQVYRSGWRNWHNRIRNGESPYIPAQVAKRSFVIPPNIKPNRPGPEQKGRTRQYDVVMISDFRMVGGNTISTIEEMHAQIRAGVRTAICQVNSFRPGVLHKEFIDEKVEELVSAGLVDWISLEDNVNAKLLTIRYPAVFQFSEGVVSNIRASTVRVIVNQPPSERDTRDRRYDALTCRENIRTIFGDGGIWAPIGPLVREAVVDSIPPMFMANTDWYNVIDVGDWLTPRTELLGDRPVIGRHSRDDYSKWPDTSETLFSVYPRSGDIDVRILGGIDSIASLVGEVPENWTVFPFNSVAPRDFVKQIDFLVFFHHPERLEAFGRTVIEGMAAGCVCILPISFEPLFKDSAIYCEPEEVPSIVRELHADPESYAALSKKGVEFVESHFGYSAHILRLRSLGVKADVAKLNRPAPSAPAQPAPAQLVPAQ